VMPIGSNSALTTDITNFIMSPINATITIRVIRTEFPFIGFYVFMS
jgi:hypothetical protein